MSLTFLSCGAGGNGQPLVLDFWGKDFYQNFQHSLGVDFGGVFLDTAKTGKLDGSSKVL